jgi:hypothetical protein
MFEALLESLGAAYERFLERAARVQTQAQPHVLHDLTGVLIEEGPFDPSLKLTNEESGLLFLVLKTVVDLLDDACVPRSKQACPKSRSDRSRVPAA